MSHEALSLSIVIIIIKITTQDIIPQKNTHTGNEFFVAKLPKIVVTNIAVSRLINILLQFSRCLLSKVIILEYHKILLIATMF